MPVEWEISFKGWKQEEKNLFLKASNSITIPGILTYGDESVLYPFFAKVIKKWPHAYDPADIKSYGKLEPWEFEEVSEKVGAAFQEFARQYRESRIHPG